MYRVRLYILYNFYTLLVLSGQPLLGMCRYIRLCSEKPNLTSKNRTKKLSDQQTIGILRDVTWNNVWHAGPAKFQNFGSINGFLKVWGWKFDWSLISGVHGVQLTIRIKWVGGSLQRVGEAPLAGWWEYLPSRSKVIGQTNLLTRVWPQLSLQRTVRKAARCFRSLSTACHKGFISLMWGGDLSFRSFPFSSGKIILYFTSCYYLKHWKAHRFSRASFLSGFWKWYLI